MSLRLVATGLVALVRGFGVASGAIADPNPDINPNASGFNLDCGSAGVFPVAFVESHLGTFHVVGSTSIFQSSSLTIDGTLIFAKPGFSNNDQPELTCTFIGV